MGDEKDIVYEGYGKNMDLNAAKSDDLKVSQEYNRKLYDSAKGKQNYKDKVFGDKQTYYGPISGKTLHKSENAAKNKYHMKNKDGENISSAYAKYSAETDHIIPLENIHKRCKNNPFLSDKDLKEIANIEENYRILSKSINTSKGKKSDFEVAFDKNNDMSFEGRKELIEGKLKSEVAVNKKIAGTTLKNAGIAATSVATETALITLAVSGINNIIDVANGKKSAGEAVEDVAVNTVSSSGAAAANFIVGKIVKDGIGIPIDMIPSAQVAMVAMTAVSVVKYLDGELSGEECALEIIKNGAGAVAFAIGSTLGPIGSIVTTVVVSQICATIIDIQQKMRADKTFIKEKEKELNNVVKEGLAELERQRQHLQAVINEEFEKWDKAFDYGFAKIIDSALNNDFEGMSEGLGSILGIFDKKVLFSNLEEFDKVFFDDTTEIVF